MSSETNVGNGADAELTTLIFEVAARRVPLQHLISRIHRNRTSDGNGVASILSIPGIDGTIPLHRACQFGSPAMVKYLLELGVRHRVAGQIGGAGGLFVECRPDENTRVPTPMNLAVDRVRSICDREKKNILINSHRDEKDTTKSHSDDEGWEVLAICVRYADAARYRRPIETTLANGQHGTSVIAAAVGIVPVDLLAPMMVRDKKITATTTGRFGRSILTKVIHLATEAQQNYGEEDKFDDWRIVLQTLMDKQNNSHLKDAATVEKCRGQSSIQIRHRHPLHIATEYGLDWSNGIEPILQSDYDVLLVQDTNTRLYPFMLAAAGMNFDNSRRRVLQLLKSMLAKRYMMCGGINPWIDLYSCFHCADSNSNKGYDSSIKFMKKKKNELWKDILYGSKEEDHVTVLRPDLVFFRNREGTATLCKEEAFSIIYAAAGMQSNLDTTFELLRQNPAIMNQFVVNVTSTVNSTFTARSPKRNDCLCERERKRIKQRGRRRRLRQKNKKLVAT